MPGLFIERHARSVAGHVDVGVLYVHPDDELREKKYDIDISNDDELKQVRIYFKTSRSKIGWWRSIKNTFRYLRSHAKGFNILNKSLGKPDILHVNVLTRLGVIAWFYKQRHNTPYVITEHWTRYLPMMDNFNGIFRKWASRVVVRGAAAVLPVTENLQKAMESHGLKNKNYIIIPNVVDTEMFHPEERKERSGRARILHVSCFEDKQKNISGLLRVLKRLSEQRDDWEIDMVGEGIHFEKLVKYGTELGIRDTFVHFRGLKEGQELAKYMREADFQVLFSRFENLPVVILESYACGVPFLSTDVGGIYERMSDDLGLLIPSEDEDALLEKLNFMIDNRDQYHKDKIREYALKHFSREVIGESLFNIYKEIVS